MDKQIRVSSECHAALKKSAFASGRTLRAVADVASKALTPYVLVAVNSDGKHFVEVYTEYDIANERRSELLAHGFSGSAVSLWSRCVQDSLNAERQWGPSWCEAVGWTPAPGVEDADEDMSDVRFGCRTCGKEDDVYMRLRHG